MKKSLFYSIIAIVLLSVAVSCNGGIDEDVFDKNIHKYELQLDGSWQCMRDGCYECLEGTTSPYIALIEDGEIKGAVIPLTEKLNTTVGSASVKVENGSVSYENTNGKAQKVIIRTNRGTLTVNGKTGDSAKTSDEIYHYGSAEEVKVNVAKYCFYTHAYIEKMSVSAGKAIADENGYVALIEAIAGTDVEEQNGGIIVIPEETEASKIPEVIVEELGYKVSDNKIVLDESTKAGQEKGKKIDESVCKISSYDDLEIFKNDYKSGKISPKVVELTEDIDMKDKDWTPIGTWEYPFHGVFKGNGKTINGLTLTSTADSQIYSHGKSINHDGEIFGFFGIVGDGDVTISDVTFTGVNICSESAHNVGTVIGYVPLSRDFSDAENGKGGVYAPGKWTDNTKVGCNNIYISNVSVSGKIDVYAHAGGLIGKLYNNSNAVIKNCNVSDMSISMHYTGGLSAFVGYTNGATTDNLKFENCSYDSNSSLNFSYKESSGTCGILVGDFFAGYGEASVNEACLTTTSIKSTIDNAEKLTTLRLTFSNGITITGKTFGSTNLYNYKNRKVILDNCSGLNIISNKGDLTISSGTYNGSVTNNSDSTLTINGGLFNGTVTNKAGGTFTISGGTFNKINNYSSMTISNGTFNGTFTNMAGGTLTISGGTFKNITNSGSVSEISGGKYIYASKNIRKKYENILVEDNLKDGFEANKVEESTTSGYFEVKQIAD